MALSRKFRYETLLRIRRRQEDLCAQALATARREVHATEEKRDQIADEQMRALSRAGESLDGEFDASDIRRYYQYERHLARLRDATDARIQELQGLAEARRQELEAATKSKRVMERLKERRVAAYQAGLRDIEQRALDEVATVHAALGRALGREEERSKR